MTSDRWKTWPHVARAVEEAFAQHGDAKANEALRHALDPPNAPSLAFSDPVVASVSEVQQDNIHAPDDACPELGVLIDLLGTPEAAHDVAALLIEVTAEDIAELDRSIRSCDFDRAALRLHRIVGGYQILGPSLLVDEGRALLAELRTQQGGATLSRLCRFRDQLISMLERLEMAVAAQRAGRLLSA